MNRPVDPREPLKRTADNNWVHVTCAVWTPEVKFGNAKALGPSEGIPLIPRARYAEVCRVCKKDGGACVSCHSCRIPVHVECAHQGGYVLGFDITPVKGSRRDQFNIVSIHGESGAMSAAVWCKEHTPKTTIHLMHDVVDENGTNALQLYVQNFKQADLTLTGCARKANQITVASKMSTSSSPPAPLLNRRSSTTTMVNGDHRDPPSPTALRPGGKICLTCNADVSPKWHPIDQTQERELTNGYYGNLGMEAQRFVEQRSFQCHKCKKSGKQPMPHSQISKEPTPPPEPARQVSQPPAVAANPPMGLAETRLPSRGQYGAWSPPAPASAVQPSSLQAPPGGPIAAPLMPPTAQNQPVAPPPLPPTMTQRGPSLQPPQFSPANRSYEWHRPSTGQGPPPVHPARELNGGPSPPPPGAMAIQSLANHLRPPPLSNMSHVPPPSQNGHLSQPPFTNGLPPSPQRMNGQPPPQGPYMPPHHSYNHGQTELRSAHANMNTMPPVVSAPHPSDGQRPPNYLRWNHGHMAAPHHAPSRHASPPPHRDNISMAREPSNPTPRENRPASGASASPSLRNLLS